MSILSEDEFKEQLKTKKDNQYTLIGKYISKEDNTLFKCLRCNEEFISSPKNILRRKTCPKCGNKNRNDKDFREDILNKVPCYEIISKDEIKNVRQIIKIKCKYCNREDKKEVRKLLEGRQCKCLVKEKLNTYYEESKYTLDEVKDLISNTDNSYILEDKIYKGTHIPLNLFHEKCNSICKISLNNFLYAGTRCSCENFKSISNKEKSLVKYIKSFYKGAIITSDRKILDGQELDIYFPDLKLAIEYDGLYYHSDKILKERNVNYTTYHLNKTKMCEEKGIRLIHIFENEWNNKNDDESIRKQKIVKSKLKYILHCCNNKRIHSKNKNCYIKEITNSKKSSFLYKYHLQGNDNSCIKLGLFGKSPKTGKKILLSVMTFCKPRFTKGENNYDYELSRFASNSNYVVLDAYSTLFDYFKDNYKWSSIITYANRRWSNGDVYLKNNWKKVKNKYSEQPSYWYVKGSKLENRMKYQKHKLKKLFPDIYSDSLSEKEIMEKLGYNRIYDCGNMVFEYIRK